MHSISRLKSRNKSQYKLTPSLSLFTSVPNSTASSSAAVESKPDPDPVAVDTVSTPPVVVEVVSPQNTNCKMPDILNHINFEIDGIGEYEGTDCGD